MRGSHPYSDSVIKTTLLLHYLAHYHYVWSESGDRVLARGRRVRSDGVNNNESENV